MGLVQSRGRSARNYAVTIEVPIINSRVLGRELIERCGNEGQWPYNDAVTVTTQKFLQAAISGIPMAINDGANLKNAAFILSQPGREFVIISGNGDWEFFFSQHPDGSIRGECVRKPFLRYIWDNAKSVVRHAILPLAGAAPWKMLTWAP